MRKALIKGVVGPLPMAAVLFVRLEVAMDPALELVDIVNALVAEKRRRALAPYSRCAIEENVFLFKPVLVVLDPPRELRGTPHERVNYLFFPVHAYAHDERN